jgi:uncharacterized protein (DUF58 family)
MTPPTLEELLALRAAAQGLSLTTRQPVRARMAGVRRALQRGRGLEFQEVRPYVQGDDPRSIDWRVTARRGRPHTRLYREERERPVWLLADLSPGMYFGTRRQLKSQQVVRAAALLAWTAVAGGDRVGAVVAGREACQVLPPRGREAGVLPLLPLLLSMQPPGPAGAPGEAHLLAGLTALLPVVHPGSLVLVLSDFAAPAATAAPQWSALAAHSDCHLFFVSDPLETQGLPEGRFRVGFFGGSRVLDGGGSRGAWQAAFQGRRQRVEDLALRCAAPLTGLSTADDAVQLLRPLFLSRRAA